MRVRRKVRADAGLDWVTPHSIRMTVATLLDTRLSTKVAAAQLGHTNIAMTERHYVQRPVEAQLRGPLDVEWSHTWEFPGS